MNREIKFRGKRKDNGEWVVGDLTRYSEEMSYITVDLIEGEVYKVVHTKTIGQFTGFHDKNGAEIYEGDIIETKYKDRMEESGIGFVRNEIRFCEGAFCWIGEISGEPERLEKFDCESAVVAGNIHENPELLK